MSSDPPPLGPKKLRLTRAAENDIDAIVDYIAEQAGLAIAQKFADRIDRELNDLADLGHGGVSREWISPGLRLATIGEYCVYFRISRHETLIVRVLHGSRDITRQSFDDSNS